jgi:RNA polymerase sigma-70 factor (ECF subfamily)
VKVTARENDASREWFVNLWQEHFAYLLRYASRIFNDKETAAEIAADAMSVAWKKPWKVPYEVNAQRAWLYAVAKNIARNAHRSKSRQTRLIEAVSSVIRESNGGEDFCYVSEALETLSDSELEVLVLKYWEGLDAGEIAVVVGCKREAAQKRLQRARERFEEAYLSVKDFRPEINNERGEV